MVLNKKKGIILKNIIIGIVAFAIAMCSQNLHIYAEDAFTDDVTTPVIINTELSLVDKMTANPEQTISSDGRVLGQLLLEDSAIVYADSNVLSSAIGMLYTNDVVWYYKYEFDQNAFHGVKIQYVNGQTGYIDFPATFITEKVNSTNYPIYTTSTFKTYMSYKAITKRGSAAYKMASLGSVDADGFLTYKGRYLVAVGTGVHAAAGTYIDAHLGNGTVIHCIVSDIKADIHTDSTNTYTVASNCPLEFLVSTSSLVSTVRTSGNVSNYKEEWKSNVEYIETFEKSAI